MADEGDGGELLRKLIVGRDERDVQVFGSRDKDGIVNGYVIRVC